MPLNVTRYVLDRTGTLPANLVTGEVHALTASATKLVRPKYGYFYKKSLVIKNTATNTPLTKAQYICTEYFEDASLKYGKEIVESILITDPALTGSVTIDYQVLGGHNSRSTENIIDVFYDRLQPNLNVPWNDLKDKPVLFTPKFGHKHRFEEIHDLGRIFTQLENIKYAITTSHYSTHQGIMTYVDDTLAKIEAYQDYFLQGVLPDAIARFKAQFNKAYFGLDRVVNMAVATNQEARMAAGVGTRQVDIAVNKYMTLSALVSFKEVIYDNVVSKLATNLGTHIQRYVNPEKSYLFNLQNGSNASYVGLETARSNNIDYDEDLYPIDWHGNDPFTITKINNGVGHRGGLFQGFNYEADGAYLGVHHTGELTDNLVWRKFLIEGVLSDVLDVARRHIADLGNPHQDTKEHIGLGLVENLQVITKTDIKTMTSKHEYLTMDMLLYFMRIFLQQNGWHVELPEGHKNKFLLDNCQVVFSPCGQCGCSDRSDFQPEPSPPPPSCPAAGTLLRTFCSDSIENEPADDEVIPNGFNKYGVYTDGECGEEVRLITANSPDCGWEPPKPGATYEIRDAHDRLLGMGWAVTDEKPATATVAVTNSSDEVIFYLYPASGEGYDSAILGHDGSFIGFAVNP